MDLLNFTGFKSREATKQNIRIGTPDEPIYVNPLYKRPLTGPAARRSESDILARVARTTGFEDVDPDLLLPTATRQQRRAVARGKETERRKNVARYKRRVMKAEREAYL